MPEFVSPLSLLSDVSSGDWLRRRMPDFGPVVGGMLPTGFDAYAKVLHPASDAQGNPVRWAQVAAWAGRRLRSEAWFEDISVPVGDSGLEPAPWAQDPAHGEIPYQLLAVLERILSRYTASQRGFFCLWDGWAMVHGTMTRSVSWPKESPTLPGTASRYEASPAFSPEARNGPKVRLPGREYLLFEGPLGAAGELGAPVSWVPVTHELAAPELKLSFETQTPSLFWPADRAWCVANDIDASFTCVAGTTALINALLDHAELEAITVPV